MRFLRWNRQDDELTQELRNHIEMAVQERMERGRPLPLSTATRIRFYVDPC